MFRITQESYGNTVEITSNAFLCEPERRNGLLRILVKVL